MKKLLKIGLFLFVAGLITAALVWKFYVNKPHEDIENATPAFIMTTGELWRQYNSEYKTADSMYTGKVIELSGTITHTEKSDSLVYVVFVMEEDSLFGDKSVRCEMFRKYNDETFAIAAASPVRIKGFCTGYDQTDVKFNKCSIVK
jgi:hypothetical protein